HPHPGLSRRRRRSAGLSVNHRMVADHPRLADSRGPHHDQPQHQLHSFRDQALASAGDRVLADLPAHRAQSPPRTGLLRPRLRRDRALADDHAHPQRRLRTDHPHQASTREPPKHRGRHDHPHQTDPPRRVTTSKEAPKMTNMAQPLAARMRPTSLDEIVGQDHLVYDGSPLSLLADGKSRSSVLLYGPPGTGKTSIA